MENPFLPNDAPVAVTRIEWELLDNCKWRWTAFSNDRRIMSQVASSPADVDKLLEATGIFARAMTAGRALAH